MKDIDRIITFRILGEPQPEPKKELGLIRNKSGRMVHMPIDRDYRTRQRVDSITKQVLINPKNGKPLIEKYDRGYKAKWVDHVQRMVWSDLMHLGRHPFPQHFPVAVGMVFFLSKPKSNKKEFPVGVPDLLNLWECIENALKKQNPKSQKEKAVLRKYPEGVLWWDDSQIVGFLEPTGVFWATQAEPPGLMLSVCPMQYVGWARQFLDQGKLPFEPTLKLF